MVTDYRRMKTARNKQRRTSVIGWLEERPVKQFYRYLLKATSLVSVNYLEYI